MVSLSGTQDDLGKASSGSGTKRQAGCFEASSLFYAATSLLPVQLQSS
jgi:hypothetical protein